MAVNNFIVLARGFSGPTWQYLTINLLAHRRHSAEAAKSRGQGKSVDLIPSQHIKQDSVL